MDRFFTAINYFMKPQCTEGPIRSQKWQNSYQANNQRHNIKESTDPTNCLRSCPTNCCQGKIMSIHQKSLSQASWTRHPAREIKDHPTRILLPPQGLFRKGHCTSTTRLSMESHHQTKARHSSIHQRMNLPSYPVREWSFGEAYQRTGSQGIHSPIKGPIHSTILLYQEEKQRT